MSFREDAKLKVEVTVLAKMRYLDKANADQD